MLQHRSAADFTRAMQSLVRPLYDLNRNPVAWRFANSQLVYYGIFAALNAAFTGTMFAYYLYLKGQLHHVDLLLVLPGLALSVWFFSRLFHLIALGRKFFRKPVKYLLETGFYVQGGIFGAGLGAVVVSTTSSVDLLVAVDGLAYGAVIGLVFGRLGCYTYGCCHGRPTSVPWGTVYHHPESKVLRLKPELAGKSIHPTQLYTSLANLVGFAIITVLIAFHPADGFLAAFFLLFHGSSRLLIERFRGDTHFHEGRNWFTRNVALVFLVAGLSLGVSSLSTGLQATTLARLHEPGTFVQLVTTDGSTMLGIFAASLFVMLGFGLHGRRLGSFSRADAVTRRGPSGLHPVVRE
jgi:prolipoprotein diacylglyceryltransferase